jgi:hypothetical protein
MSKTFLKELSYSGLWSKQGKLLVPPVGETTPIENPSVPIEPAGPSELVKRIRAGNASTPEIKSVRNLLIRDKKGNIIGKVGGSKVKPKHESVTPYYDLLEASWCGTCKEDTMTGAVASFELPMRGAEEEIARKRKRRKFLQQTTAMLGGVVGSY